MAEEDEATSNAEDEPVDEQDAKDRKLQADIDAAVQKEFARERRLKKTVCSIVVCPE